MADTSLNHWTEVDQAVIRAELDRIMKSGPFQQSRRRQRFLEYIVSEALAGRGERLKGYNVGLEVFDRPETFDPLVDPVVRIEAARLRDKLREYYETEGQGDPVRIELPKGSYAPLIEIRTTVTLSSSKPASTRRVPDPPFRWQFALGLALAVFLIFAAGSSWRQRSQHAPASASREAGRPALASGAPVIAVLPFLNLSGDPKQEYFSDGLTEDILVELARARELTVVARNTTFQFKGQETDISRLVRDLNVDYVLQGSVRRSDDRLRITAQLTDVKSSSTVWADKYDRELADVLGLQDEIVGRIVGRIAGGYGAIQRTNAKRAARKSASELQAYDLVLRARDAMWEWNRSAFRTAHDLLQQAVVLDPANARAHRELAWIAAASWVFYMDAVDIPPDKFVALAVKAVQLDPADARARMVAASAYFWTNQLELFRHEADQALALAPNEAEIMATLGFMFAVSGQWTRGLAMVDKANALNAEAAVAWYHSARYTDCYLRGDYQCALVFRQQNPDQSTIYAYIEEIQVFGQLGRQQDAQKSWRKLLAENPDWSADDFVSWHRRWNKGEADIAKFMDGVKKSGVLHLGGTL